MINTTTFLDLFISNLVSSFSLLSFEAQDSHFQCVAQKICSRSLSQIFLEHIYISYIASGASFTGLSAGGSGASAGLTGATSAPSFGGIIAGPCG